ncbi:MAG TPA: ATP-binding protein [Alphaproteobacteria bacterium]|nr:ATP-binding protein [Alphaproteobacteria bacterium]
MTRKRALVAWSSGKDSAYALHLARQDPGLDVVGLLTTVTDAYERVAMHGVREALLDAQAASVGLPLVKVRIPSPCPNQVYERAMGDAMAQALAQGVDHVVFGDLFLADIRAYREKQLARIGMTPLFPLWLRDTGTLAREMIADGLSAVLTCVDPKQLDRSFAGRRFDGALLDALPSSVDPCGENGEFHTLVTAGPMFARPLRVRAGEVVERDGFVFADVLPA